MNRQVVLSMFLALVVLPAGSAPRVAEVQWPKDSAGDLSIFVATLRYRIFADHCSDAVPSLKPQFESLVANLDRRVRGIANRLLASGAFGGLDGKPVPPSIVDAFKDSFDDLKHNFERRDADVTCPKTLHELAAVDDASLQSDLVQALTAVQNMMRNLQDPGAR